MSLRACTTCGVQKSDSNFASAFTLICNACALNAQSGAMGKLDFSGLDVTRTGDSFIVEKSAGPTISGQLKKPDFGGIRTQRAPRRDDSVAKMLMRSRYDNVGPISYQQSSLPDDRPLIDKLHEATFTDSVGMQWFNDKYALRMLLRKTHCFTLDKATSALVSDFSVAIAHDLEVARRIAIPPFDHTWVEIDNVARLDRLKAMGIPLTKQAAGETAGGPVERVGWLILPGEHGGWSATYVTEVDQGIATSPLSYWWHAGSPSPLPHDQRVHNDKLIERLTFGVKDSGVGPTDAFPCATALHGPDMNKVGLTDDMYELMSELSGELRHIWGFLVALGAGQLGMEASFTSQPKPMTERKMPNGKPLLPLEHKVLHLHLAKRMTVDKVIARAITHHKHREHDVRAHFRALKNPDGTVRARVPVCSNAIWR